MTWAKTGVEFPADCANVDLSDAAYRVHHEVICWLYLVERFDCLIPKRLVRRVAGSDDYERAVKELLDVGFWEDLDYDYRVRHHGDVVRQSLAMQVGKRARDKQAQRRKRAHTGGTESAPTQSDKQPSKHLGPGTNKTSRMSQ